VLHLPPGEAPAADVAARMGVLRARPDRVHPAVSGVEQLAGDVLHPDRVARVQVVADASGVRPVGHRVWDRRGVSQEPTPAAAGWAGAGPRDKCRAAARSPERGGAAAAAAGDTATATTRSAGTTCVPTCF